MGGAARRLLQACVLALAVAGGAAVAAEPEADAITAAERLLFQTDHLANVGSATRLEYRYSWDGEAPYNDRVTVTVDGKRTVVPDYLSGARHIEFPSIEDAHGNPLLLFFLEDDLRQMRRSTQGSPDYFRRLIRRAMASPDLKVEATEATIAGRKVAAMRVVLEPFRADPKAPARYPAVAGKRYEFVLAATVPGQIVWLATHVPLANGKTDTVRVEWTGAASM